MYWSPTYENLPDEFLPVFLKRNEDDSFETAQVGCFLTEEGGNKGWWIGDSVKVITLESHAFWMPIEIQDLTIPILEDEEYAPIVLEFLIKLASFEKRLIRLNSAMVLAGKRKYYVDEFISGVINRSLSLLYGFDTLIRSRNFLAASHLVRSHLDNFIRLNAFWFVKDANSFAQEVLKGAQINQMLDANEKFMSDTYLKKEVSKEFPWIKNVYEETSGYVHFSKKHILSIYHSADLDSGIVKYFIGKTDNKISNELKLQAIICMIDITNHLIKKIFFYIMEKRQ